MKRVLAFASLVVMGFIIGCSAPPEAAGSDNASKSADTSPAVKSPGGPDAVSGGTKELSLNPNAHIDTPGSKVKGK